jgi:hypothetical protein
VVGGTVLKNPPAHWTKLFFSDRYTRGPALIRSEQRTSQHEDYVLDGSHLITVEVRRPDKATTRPAPFLASSSGSYSSGDNLYMTELARKTVDAYNRKSDAKAATSGAGADKATNNAVWTAGKEYPHMRSLLQWTQDSFNDFSPGKTDAATVDSWGRITPAFQDTAKKQIDKDVRIWSAVWANGNFWFGTSDKIYRWNGGADSAPEQVAQINGLAIPAMSVDSGGTVYAASVPAGTIYALDSTKSGAVTPRVVAKVPEQIITSLCVDEADNLYAGVTGSGKVYKLARSFDHSAVERTAVTLFDCGQASVTCLFYDKVDKRLYVGTAEKGAVYSVDAERGPDSVRAEYQTPDHIVTGVVKDSKGDMYVATAAQGRLVKIPAQGGLINLATSEAFYSLYYDALGDAVFSGDGEGDITHAQTDPISHESYFVPVCHSEQEAILALAGDGKGTLFAGTSNLAVARTFNMQFADNARYTSIVKDAGRSARWSRLRAYGAYNEVSEQIGRRLAVDSRSGETSQPDSTWCGWQQATFHDGSFVLSSSPGRYMQYRISWKADTNSAAGLKALTEPPVSIGKVEVSYLPANVAPEFVAISMKTGTAFSGKEDFTISANDNDGDNLCLAVDVSGDGGKSWTQVASNLRSKHAERELHAFEKTAPDQGNSVKHKPENIEEQPPTKVQDALLPAGSVSLSSASSRATDPGYEWKNEHRKDRRRDPGDGRVSLDESKDAKDGPQDGKDVKPGEGDVKNDKDKEAKHDDQSGKDTDGKKADAQSDPGKTEKSKTSLPAPGPSGEKFAWTWDTTKVKDGSYLVKFTADDLPSNPNGHLQTIAMRTVDVENSMPEITAMKLTAAQDKSGVLRVTAHDKHTPIVNATYRFDDGEPFALGNPDNITDGLDAEFVVSEITIPAGSHKLEVQVTNKAGNTATKTINVL